MNENNNENEKLFEEYLDKQSGGTGIWTTPRTWLIIFGVFMAVVLAIFFYKSVFLESWDIKDIKRSVTITWHETQWIETESTPYGIKIVPMISFKAKNTGDKPLQYVRFQGVFVFEDTGALQGDGGIHTFKVPLQPGQESDILQIKNSLGIKGSSKEAFMANINEWRKVQVKLFVMISGSVPVQLEDPIPVARVIEGYNSDSTDSNSSEKNERIQKSFEKIGKALQITGQNSIWADRMVSSKKVIIVPSITFQVKNIGKEPLQDLLFKGDFFFEDNGEKLSEGIADLLGIILNQGDTSTDITLRSPLGYESTSKKAFIDNNKSWRKVSVRIYAKQKDLEYVQLGTFPIKQQIEGVKIIYDIPQ